MFKKNTLYNLLILTVYLITCFLIFNQNKKEVIKPKIKNYTTIKETKEEIGNITINKINLQKPLYSLTSNKNNVDQNVTILKGSTFPDQEESILFIAAHSGNSEISYFEKLDQLQKEDIVKITYRNKEYFYKISNIWEEKKNGYIHVKKESKKQLILTTCSRTNKEKQLVISSNLI